MTKQEMLDLALQKQARFAALSDFIWDHPETAFEETVSAQALQYALEEHGFQVAANLAGIPTAFSGTWGQGKPVIGFLGEFDALSGMSQQAGVLHSAPLESGGNGHGCGHNLLGAGSLAAAVLVKEYLQSNHLSGTVVYFGCPGEEGGSGKTFMAREGTFDGLDCAITWHPGDLNAVIPVSLLANVQLSYHFHVRSAHAAVSPHLGRSALDAVALMNTGVQYLREHMIPEARIHYAITNAGGSSPNVVQAEAEVLYLIRAPQNQQVQELRQRVEKIAQGAALMTETQVTSTFYKACSNVVPNQTLCQCMQQNLESVPFPPVPPEWERDAKAIFQTLDAPLNPMQKRLVQDGRFISSVPTPLMPGERCMSGSSDVGDVSWICPTVQCTAATAALGTPAHSWQQVAQGKSPLAHAATMYAAQVMAGTAVDLLEQQDLLVRAKEELLHRLDGQSYACPIPADAVPRKMDVCTDNAG